MWLILLSSLFLWNLLEPTHEYHVPRTLAEWPLQGSGLQRIKVNDASSPARICATNQYFTDWVTLVELRSTTGNGQVSFRQLLFVQEYAKDSEEKVWESDFHTVTVHSADASMKVARTNAIENKISTPLRCSPGSLWWTETEILSSNGEPTSMWIMSSLKTCESTWKPVAIVFWLALFICGLLPK